MTEKKPTQVKESAKTKKPKVYRTKSVTKAKLLFIYITVAGIVSFIYAISCVFTHFSYWYAAIPYSLLAFYGIGLFFWKNWRMIWVFIQNIERGRLLHVMNNETAFEYSHKLKVLDWIYPRKNMIRKEHKNKIDSKIYHGLDLTKQELKDNKKKVASCPQQLLDGVQKLILVRVLIYAHENIQVLDDELREILELTDENIDKFDFDAEVERIKSMKN